jgi:alpha-tubulin suppressor-like RCC1 family protein
LGLGDVFDGFTGFFPGTRVQPSIIVDGWEPVRSEPSVRFRGVSAGHQHCVAVSEEGLVYLWGSKSNPASMLLSDREPRRVPTVVEPLRGTRIRMVAAGAAHSVALSDYGFVLT